MALTEPPPRQCVVVGGGIIGLTSAVRLLERGWAVTVLADAFGASVTSHGSGAVWEYPPYEILPVEAAKDWASASLLEYLRLAQIEESGVVLRPHVFLSRTALTSAQRPDGTRVVGLRADGAEVLRRVAAHVPVAAGYRDAFAYVTPVADMPVLLDFLASEVGRKGGRVVRLACKFGALRDAREHGWLVVNCTGLGAAQLSDCADKDLFAQQGDTVLVKCPSVTTVYVDEENPRGMAYVIPRSELVLLGGTSTRVEQLANGDFPPIQTLPSTFAAIVERCSEMVPALRGATVVRQWSGYRPCRRGGVRLDVERCATHTVIHNYGHGGSGMTVAWGCAADVVCLAEQARTEVTNAHFVVSRL